MRSTLISTLALSTILSSACLAQEWEIGALAGFSWHRNTTITNPAGSATIGFEPRFAVGAVFTENLYEHISGEIRYMFLVGQPMLKFRGTDASMSGFSNVVHYDLLVHPKPKESRFLPYLAAGGGVKVYTANGRILVNQPLLNFAVLRPVNQTQPMVSVGGGLKYLITRNALLRLDFRSYMSPAPDKLFRTTFPSSINGWIFDFIPTLGISYAF
jgi:hypothetical protein